MWQGLCGSGNAGRCGSGCDKGWARGVATWLNAYAGRCSSGMVWQEVFGGMSDGVTEFEGVAVGVVSGSAGDA